MPIYEYGCPSCGHQFEEIQKVSDDPMTECPACGENGLKKMISAPSFHLKGGGWYKDHDGLKAGASSSATSTATESSSSSDGD